MLRFPVEHGVCMDPNPADAGMLFLIVLCILKSILFVKKHPPFPPSSWRHPRRSLEEEDQEVENYWELAQSPRDTFKDIHGVVPQPDAGTQVPQHSWGQHLPKQECIVYLTKFELDPDAEVDRIRCDHVFHRMCLEKWLKFQKLTCPLCRMYMVEDSAPM